MEWKRKLRNIYFICYTLCAELLTMSSHNLPIILRKQSQPDLLKKNTRKAGNNPFTLFHLSYLLSLPYLDPFIVILHYYNIQRNDDMS